MIEINLVIAAMLAIIKQHGLRLMETYPNDLLVHDRAVLERIAVKGGCAAWVVGDTHTHIVELGMTREENQKVTYLTNQSSNDRFYRIDFGFGLNGMTFTELDRKKFEALKDTPVRYEPSSYGLDFTLRKSGENSVGRVSITCLDAIKHQYEVDLMPSANASRLDRAALYAWASERITGHGTLFASWNVRWFEPAKRELLAA